MMLADHIIQAKGTVCDVGGMMTSIGSAVARAQRFAMNREAAAATLELLRARPSGLIKVMPVCRLPYQTMWIETESGFSSDVNHRDPGVAPIPAMQGTLIETMGDRHGVMTVAWVHRPKHDDEFDLGYMVNASPYSLYFDFREDGDASALANAAHDEIKQRWSGEQKHAEAVTILCDRICTKFALPLTDEGITDFMLQRSWWQRWAHDKHEIEALRQHDRHMRVGLGPHGVGAILEMLDVGTKTGGTEFFVRCMKNWEQDIAGEGPFAQFFIAMLNSRNCVEQEQMPMAKLNKARAKRDKPPLLDYTKIKLVMSRTHARVARARGLSPQITREQLVRGHFKTRRTGVYWWNEYERYKERGLEPSQRKSYEVAG